MPHVELYGLRTEPGAAEWFAVGLLGLAALCLIGLAIRYALRSRRAAAGTHRTTTSAATPSSGSTVVCAALGFALLGVAASMVSGIAMA